MEMFVNQAIDRSRKFGIIGKNKRKLFLESLTFGFNRFLLDIFAALENSS